MHGALHTVARKKRIAKHKSAQGRMQFLMQENMPAFTQNLTEALLFFFLSLSECFELPSPFAACAVGAFVMAKKRLFWPYAGLAASLFLRAFWQVETDIWQYIGCVMLGLFAFKPPRSITVISAAVTAVLSLRIFSLILSPSTQKDMVLCTVSLLVGALCTPAFCHVALMSQKRLSRMGIDDLLCCLVLCAVMLSGAGRVMIGIINIGFVLSGFAILLCAAVGGCTAAVCAGLLCGISLSICGHADGYVVCFAFSGVVCGLMYGHKRLMLCFVYLLCSAFSSYAVHFALDPNYLAASFVSCIAFMLLPRRLISTAFTLTRRLSPDATDNENAYAQHMRAQWAGNLQLLSHLLPEVRAEETDIQERLDDIRERMCAGCNQMPICWNEKASATAQTLCDYFISSDRSAILPACQRLQAWPALALDYERSAQQQLLRTAYANREREATRTHLSAIAQAMTHLSLESLHCDKDDDVLLGEAAYLLRQMRIAGRIVYALRISQHITIALRYEPPITRQKQIDRYLSELSARLNRPLRIAQRSKDMILIEEAPALTVECFHLSASSGDGNGENGDSILLRTGRGGMELGMLSDGMGHGAQAHEESEKTLELLSLCLDSGYSVEDALKAINCIMLSATDGEQYATVDLCVTDLWAEHATLYKLGACPSILISGGSLRVLQSSALPLGILPEIEASTHTFAIADGDMLIQFSDGLSDALGGMKQLEGHVSLLARDKLQRSPETICTSLMSAAMRRCGGVPPDDMTILCTRFKNSKK